MAMTQADIASLCVPLMGIVTNPRFGLWCGRGVKGAVSFMMLLVVMPIVVMRAGVAKVHFLSAPELSRSVGMLVIACTILYALPQPIVGAILLATQLTV
jgi:hypothetical protein